MPLAFVTWQKRQRICRRRFASISRIGLLWKNNPAKVDPASAAHAEDKKKGQQKEKEKLEESQDKAKGKEAAKEDTNKDKPEKKDDKKESGAKDDKGDKNDKKDNKETPEDKKEEKRKPGTLGDLLKDPNVVGTDKAEKPLAARIVAYSDSEGEDEPFRLTRRKKKKTEEDGNATETEEEVEQPQVSHTGQISAAISQTPRFLKTVRTGTKRGVTKLKRDAGWGVLLEFIMLWLFRKRRRKTAKRLELLTLAISLPDALSCAADWGCPSSKLPSKLPLLVQFVESWARPAAVFQLENLVRKLAWKKKRRKVLTTISQSARLFEEAEQNGDTSPGTFKAALPRLASEIASTYKVELNEMRRILQEEHQLRLPPERFDETNAELLRFAASAGLLEAGSPEEKAHAIQEGAKRVSKTLDWVRRRKFMSPAQLKEWHHVVRWQGTNSEGWPILVIKLAMACAQYQGDDANSVADAILGQMQRALSEVFSDQRGPDKVVVIMDASRANSLQAARHVNAFKETSVALNRHYPGRLDKLFIVDLPGQLRWVLATLRHLLHPDTKPKIQLVSINDPALPLAPNMIQTPEEQALLLQQPDVSSSGNLDVKSRRVSIPELPVSRTPPVNNDYTRLFGQKIAEEEENEEPDPEGGLPSPPKRRVRIMELPYREFERKTPRTSFEKPVNQLFSPGTGMLRPALKRSTSVGLLGLDFPAKSEEK